MPADLVITAQTVITMNPAQPRAEAVAVDTVAGTISAIGSLADMRASAPGATVQDLGDTVLMPGFVEAHSHPLALGDRNPGARTLDRAVRRLRDLARRRGAVH